MRMIAGGLLGLGVNRSGWLRLCGCRRRCTPCGLLREQGLVQAFVTPVNIGPEIDRSALAAPRRRIRQVYGQPFREVDDRPLARFEDGIDTLALPAWGLPQDQFGKIDWTGQPDAARTEGARGMAEYLAPRRGAARAERSISDPTSTGVTKACTRPCSLRRPHGVHRRRRPHDRNHPDRLTPNPSNPHPIIRIAVDISRRML